MEDYNGAIKALNKSIELNPVNPSAYLNRGLAKLMIGLKNEACKDLEMASNFGNSKAKGLIARYCGQGQLGIRN